MTNQSTITRQARSVAVSGTASPIPTWVLAVGLVVVIAITTIVALNVVATDTAELTPAQQADQARWEGMAEAFAASSLAPGWQADMDRQTALAEHYSASPPLSRAQQAEADRLQGLADSTTQHLTRAQQAEADRLQGLADSTTTQHLTRAQQAEADRLQGLADSTNGD